MCVVTEDIDYECECEVLIGENQSTSSANGKGRGQKSKVVDKLWSFVSRMCYYIRRYSRKVFCYLWSCGHKSRDFWRFKSRGFLSYLAVSTWC